MSTDKFGTQQKEFLRFIKLLSDNDLLDKVIVVGSWAEYIYAQCGLLKDFSSNLKTLDLDFLIKNMRLPKIPASLTSIAANAGYDILHDYLEDTTKIVSPEGLEIEFLINQMGSGGQNILKTNLGVNAQALRHLDITLRNTVTVDFFSMSITVPTPEAYVIGKMVINDKRKAKAEKDQEAVRNLLPYLDQEAFQEVYNGLFKKEQKAVDEFIKNYGATFDRNKLERGVIVDDVLDHATAAAAAQNSQLKLQKEIEELLKS